MSIWICISKEDLDIVSRERVENAIQEYPGTILFVSHDRYFIKEIANEIWNLSKDRLACFVGNYEQFKNRKKKGRDDNYIDDLLTKMKKAELIAKLEQVNSEEEKEKINEKLEKFK